MILGKYNQAKTVTFDLVAPDGIDLIINATFAAGDVVIMKDEGAEASTTNLPTDEGTGYSLVLTAAEMSAARIRVYIIDQTATKIWLDTSVGVETYGNASSEHAFDLDTAAETMRGTDSALLAANINLTGGAVDTVTTVTNQVTADVTAISGDTTAADNLELQYDTTGLIGDTFPATQAAIGNLATGSAAISVVSESDTVTTGTEVNTYAVTDEVDQVYHEITDVTGVMELYYQFDVGGNGVASEIQMTGRLQGANDIIGVYAYNWGATSWDQIGSMQGANSSTDGVSAFNLLTRHTGTGTNIGKVRIRGYAASGLTSATLYIDQAIVSYAVVAQSVGYANGMIWIDTVHGVAGTETFVNGVADNPVDSIADAISLSSSAKANLSDWHISSDSNFAPAVDIQGYNVYGIGYTCTLGGHDYAGTHIFHASPMTGIATTTGGSDHFDVIDSIVGNITVDNSHFTRCSFNGTITLDQITGGDLKIVDSRSIIAGSGTPIIDCGIAVVAHNISISNWQNGIEIRNFNNGGTNLFSISGTGQLIVASTCSGTMNVRGQFKITDNSGGNVTFVFDDVHQDIEDVLVDTADMQPKLGIPAGADMSADIAAIKADTAAILIDTNELQGDWTNGGRLDVILDAILDDTGTSGVVLTAVERSAIADAILDRDMSTGTDSGSPTVRTVRQALRANRNKVSISGGTMTVTKEDDTTASWTASITTTAGDPISAIDPA